MEPVRRSERRSYVGLYQKEEAAWVSNSVIRQNIGKKNNDGSKMWAREKSLSLVIPSPESL